MAAERKTGWLRLLSLDFLIAAVLCLSSIIVFAFIANQVVIDKKDFFDTAAFRFFERHTSPGNTRIAQTITFFGSGSFLFPAYLVILGYLVFRRKIKYAIVIAAIAAVSLLLGNVLKSAFQRERPLYEHLDYVRGYSFPSGHTLAAFTFTGIVLYMIWQTKWRKGIQWLCSLLVFVFACLIGLSRIYLHVHFASDVIGGFCTTIVWLSVCFVYFTWGEKKWLV